MSEMKHTPGPWRVVGMAIEGPFTPKGHQGFGVVVAAVMDGNRPRHVADAHLIAAAPDLYEALIKVVDAIFAADLKHGLEEQIEQARLAVAKAEGR